MKYKSFNRSCSYAGLANMLLDFNIDTEDFQIVIDGNIPYIFTFDKTSENFLAGPMLQSKQYFDYYLNAHNLELKEIQLSKKEVLNFLKCTSQKCMIGLSLNSAQKHALIFEGIHHCKFKFLNNKWKHSTEPEYYYFSDDEILNKLPENSCIGYIEKLNYPVCNNSQHELNMSIEFLADYKLKVTEFCSTEQSFDNLEKAKSSLFEALFLNVLSMMEIIQAESLVYKIKDLRQDYIKAMNLKSPLILGNYISLELFNDIIENYTTLISEYMATNYS